MKFLRSLVLGASLLLQGCGAQCLDCRDAACACPAKQSCVLTDLLPASTSPGAMHYQGYACRDTK